MVIAETLGKINQSSMGSISYKNGKKKNNSSIHIKIDQNIAKQNQKVYGGDLS
jgi:hypothetical protein